MNKFTYFIRAQKKNIKLTKPNNSLDRFSLNKFLKGKLKSGDITSNDALYIFYRMLNMPLHYRV